MSPIFHAWLSIVGHNVNSLILTTTVHNFCCGVGSTILVIYVSSLCKKGNTASQFSLIWSFSSLTRIILAASSGVIAAYTNWLTFFIGATILDLPVFIIIKKLTPYFNKNA